MQKVISPLLLKSARSLVRYVKFSPLPPSFPPSSLPLFFSSHSPSLSLSLPPSFLLQPSFLCPQLLAVWVLANWMVGGEPRPCQLIELGPGRGTLLKDMMRVFRQFNRILETLSVHLVEASPALSDVQEATITGTYNRPVRS